MNAQGVSALRIAYASTRRRNAPVTSGALGWVSVRVQPFSRHKAY